MNKTYYDVHVTYKWPHNTDQTEEYSDNVFAYSESEAMTKVRAYFIFNFPEAEIRRISSWKVYRQPKFDD